MAALLAVHPIRVGEGEDDYIAVVLDAKFCHMELCAGAQDKGLQFPNGYADDKEDVVYAYQIVEVVMEQVNKERLQVASKPNKRANTKKSDAAGGTLEIADETAATGETSRPKKKSTSGGGEREASRAKKSDGKLSLAAAILQANNLTSKTKSSEVEAMYKWAIDGVHMPWYKADVHWYIVGGQHTYQACVSIAAKEVPGSAWHKFYTEFDVIPMYSRDPDMLIKVSNALNIQVKDKVVTENFRSQLGNARAKWIEKGRLHPKKGGAKHDPTFTVILLKHITPPFQNIEIQCHCILYRRTADIH